MTNKKLIPFNLERALAGDAVVTRDGRKVKELHYFKSATDSPFKLRGVLERQLESWLDSGKYVEIDKSNCDLFMAPKTKTFWINIYRSGVTLLGIGACIYKDEEECLTYKDRKDYIKTISIEIEEPEK